MLRRSVALETGSQQRECVRVDQAASVAVLRSNQYSSAFSVSSSKPGVLRDNTWRALTESNIKLGF